MLLKDTNTDHMVDIVDLGDLVDLFKELGQSRVGSAFLLGLCLLGSFVGSRHFLRD